MIKKMGCKLSTLGIKIFIFIKKNFKKNLYGLFFSIFFLTFIIAGIYNLEKIKIYNSEKVYLKIYYDNVKITDVFYSIKDDSFTWVLFYQNMYCFLPLYNLNPIQKVLIFFGFYKIKVKRYLDKGYANNFLLYPQWSFSFERQKVKIKMLDISEKEKDK